MSDGLPINPKKLAAEYLEKTAMAVVLRDVADHNWGFFTREDPRMHIQTVDKSSIDGQRKAQIWLEDKGKRTFEIRLGGTLSAKDIKELKMEVLKNRKHIEIEWIQLMIEKRWLKATHEDSIVTLIAYPGQHNTFTRTFDVRKELPAVYDRGSSGMMKTWEDKKLYIDLDENGLLLFGPQEDPDRRTCFETWNYLFHD